MYVRMGHPTPSRSWFACLLPFLPKCVYQCAVLLSFFPGSPRDDHGEPVDPSRAGARYTADPVATRGDESVAVGERIMSA